MGLAWDYLREAQGIITGSDLFSVQQAGKFLAFADEDDLAFREGSNVVFPFTWLRTFHEPVMVRVEADASGAVLLTLKLADG